MLLVLCFLITFAVFVLILLIAIPYTRNVIFRKIADFAPAIFVFVFDKISAWFWALIFVTGGGMWLRFPCFMSYFEMMYVVKASLVGLAGSLFNLIQPTIIRLFTFGRLDITQSASYMGTLVMDHNHNNPVLSTFMDVLKRYAMAHRVEKKAQNMKPQDHTYYQANTEEEALAVPLISTTSKEDNKRKKLTRYMAVLYTLKKNPRLDDKRKYQEYSDEDDE
jgi:hypothetical protein